MAFEQPHSGKFCQPRTASERIRVSDLVCE